MKNKFFSFLVAFLSPSASLFNSWSLFKKLVVANILYSLPVISLIYLMISAQNVNIDFALKEKKGNLVQIPIEKVLKSLLRLRIPSDNDKSELKNIELSFTELKATLDLVGKDLEFTEEGLKKRNRSSIEISNFEKRLQSFLKNYTSLEETKKKESLNELITDTRNMITHAGDTSNLILDPDLDSYYLMDITLLALPQTQDRISEIWNYVLSRSTTLAPEEKVQIAVYAALLKQSDLDRIASDLQTTLAEDPNFYEESPSLKIKLQPALLEFQKKTNALLIALNSYALSGTISDRKGFSELAEASFSSSFNSWHLAVAEMDVLLSKRISVLTNDKYKALLLSLIALVIAVFILFWISSKFNNNMKQVILELKKLVLDTRSSGQQLVELSDQLSSASNEQASAIEQTSAAINEIESMVNSTLHNVGVTQDTAKQSEINGQETHSSIENLISAINGISFSNEKVMQQIENNKNEMNDIKKIISDISTKTNVINEIVFQTKLLSFNASIESARAGEAGKGFSVVAQEVGELAQLSGAASKEIAEMLKNSVNKVTSISESTKVKVENLIETSKEKVLTGNLLAKECSTSVNIIMNRIQEVIKNANSIYEAAQEQSKGIAEVSEALLRLNRIAKKNMEMSEQTSHQSRTIAEQGSALDEIANMVQMTVLGKAHQKEESI